MLTSATQYLAALRLPVIAAPMFLVSNPAMAMACAHCGIVGTFPSLNHRTNEGFRGWLKDMSSGLRSNGGANRHWGVNLIVNRSNERFAVDRDAIIEHKVPLVITSLGPAKEFIREVHRYGGIVFHDVINRRHAEKALEAGVDGLILVCAGAGGHAGSANPFSLLQEIRSFYDGTIILGGGISNGRSVAAARVAGADLVYMGTRFLATEQSGADKAYKQMVLDGCLADIVTTRVVTGVSGNYLKQSLRNNDIDVDSAQVPAYETGDQRRAKAEASGKRWKHVWGAGQGIGVIDSLPPVSGLVDQLEREYLIALNEMKTLIGAYQ